MDVKAIEIDLLLEAIFQKYGYDFRNYAKASIKRRLFHRISAGGFDNPLEMTHRLLTDEAFFQTVLNDLTINVTEMFRDPPFFKTLRKHVIPILRTYPLIRIWIAGCATGEEAYSMAILLKEENLYDRSLIYATDLSEQAVETSYSQIWCFRKIHLSDVLVEFACC